MSKRAESGQPLQIAANDWNDVLDLLEPGAGGRNKRRLAPGLIRLQNNGTDLPMYGAAYYEFSNRDATAPTTIEDVEDFDLLYQTCDPSLRTNDDNWPAVCIAQEPIPAGESGIARVEGETWAKIAFDRPGMRQAGAVGLYTPGGKLGASSNPCAQILGPFPAAAGDYYSRVILFRRPQVTPFIRLTTTSFVSGGGGYNATGYSIEYPWYPLGSNPGVELGSDYFKMLGNQNWHCSVQAWFTMASGTFPAGISISLSDYGTTPTTDSLSTAITRGWIQTANWECSLQVESILIGNNPYWIRQPVSSGNYCSRVEITLTPASDHLQRRDMH